MATKLTLSIDEEVVRRAKLASKRRGKSLSKIVEEHLKAIASVEAGKKPSVQSLSGILKGRVPSDMDIKKEKGDYLKKKYGI
ncbi:MAG: DUF6364 family protein [Ilyomonas sp.]